MKNNRAIGNIYEKKAQSYIEKRGYTIIDTNYYGRHGELDIIAKKSTILVIIEVKYRKSLKYGSGLEAIDKRKMRRIYKTTEEYIYEKGMQNIDIRFDCIYFLGDEIFWIKNIAWGDEVGF